MGRKKSPGFFFLWVTDDGGKGADALDAEAGERQGRRETREREEKESWILKLLRLLAGGVGWLVEWFFAREGP